MFHYKGIRNMEPTTTDQQKLKPLLQRLKKQAREGCSAAIRGSAQPKHKRPAKPSEGKEGNRAAIILEATTIAACFLVTITRSMGALQALKKTSRRLEGVP